MSKKRMTPNDAAEALGVSAQTIRIGLQRGIFPFGWAVPTTRNRYSYVISPKLFEEYIGANNRLLEATANDQS